MDIVDLETVQESNGSPGRQLKVVPSKNEANNVHVSTAFITINDSKSFGSQGISFNGIGYEIGQWRCCKRLPNKTILQDITGLMEPGLNAIMGPTGSGKTSLLDILAGRKGKKGIAGKVLINGERQPDNFKCASGYVVQDDVVMGTLTVRENLYFSAALRLPNTMTWEEKKERVKKTIDELGLNECADTKVGTEFFRGISGGERKRTNIGMELIIEPQFLFLDEPTTGLDAYTAESVVQLLKHISSVNNRVVVLSIHQPRYSIYKQFDTLTLLSQGEMVYHGRRYEVLEHFNRLGYACEEHDNPADFLLDVINRCEREMKKQSNTKIDESGCALASSYTRSQLGQDNAKKSSIIIEEFKEREKQEGVKIRSQYGYVTNVFWQLFVVIVRSILNILRNPQLSVIQIIVNIIFGVVVGALYFDIDTGPNGYQNRIGAIFFMVMNQIFSNMNAVDIFIRQKALFIHENASGFYRVSVYFVAKLLCDIFPLRLIPLIFFSTVAYFMLGFQVAADKFFIFFLTLFLTTLAASSIAFLFSAMFRVTGLATLFVAMSFVIQMLFGGFLITLESLPVWIRWFQYFSVFRYAVEALVVNEVDGLVFDLTFNNTVRSVPGEELLEIQGFNPDWLFYDWIGLAGIVTIFFSLTYLTLRLLKKEK
ncbi:PREDICTED: ATP-binding cassette sub-family G member 2-like [Amphimedon queenslandica]|uniref:ABC transporter domain-containing protein n=2 Tax=Amphimedon queenslandica TaxID=400682 RepID=A0A1X7UE44_AMPQE|nr:PREDICTED: ATP-binding cassette sub-family G member 2-like [Amphimedon queenslandica]|eukprot:XP_019854880.1 PREDICTED: ATP-binding cassette sub-family G member 2-like [Amphimedon queenslandica]